MKRLELKINKMTSQATFLPVDFYNLPFCEPEGGPKTYNMNLGQILDGDRIQSSPYDIRMKHDVYCKQLCVTDLGLRERKGVQPNKVVEAIRMYYHNNWLLDDLPAASKVEDDTTITTRYWGGFPVGFYAVDTQKAYVHNHINFEIMYQAVESEHDKYRVVRFTIEPFSTKHDFGFEPPEVDDDMDRDDEDGDGGDSTTPFEHAYIYNPFASCKNSSGSSSAHTNYDMVYARGREPQLASGKVLFTYDIIWTEMKDISWSNRWDIYLSMDRAIPAKVHWFTVACSAVVILFLFCIILAIFCRSIRSVSHESTILKDAEEGAEETGWRSVRTDVFRPPISNPALLAVCSGTGAQLICTSVCSILFAFSGAAGQDKPGSLLMAYLLLYIAFGTVGGFTSALLYKTFGGQSWQRPALLTCLCFPGISFIMFLTTSIVASSWGSSYAVPAATISAIFFFWLALSVPLVSLGAYVGFKREISVPIEPSGSLRIIPRQPCGSCCNFIILLIGGALLFSSFFVELFFILHSIWWEQYYDTFGYLFVVVIETAITCAEVSIIYCWWKLKRENYRWWWTSFSVPGSVALYIYVYSTFVLFFGERRNYTYSYFFAIPSNRNWTAVIYFGYMGLFSVAVFFMAGSIGLFSCLLFNKKMYAIDNFGAAKRKCGIAEDAQVI